MYKRFADVYDQLVQDIPYGKWADYLQSAFLKFNKDPKLILELGCGTGSMAIELSKRGYELIGLDISSDMLSKAYEKALANNQNILFINQDMREFELFGTVDAVICLLDSLNYMNSIAEVKKVFKLVHQYLNPDGLFIFDLNSPYKLSQVLGNEGFFDLSKDITWIWDNTYDTRKRKTIFDLTFFIRNKEGLYERFDETHQETAFTTEEIRQALEDTGLRLVGNYGNLNFEPPSEKEERIFYVALKP
ncbi:MAG: class I SAM-dependent methyltransferase [Clostridiaceae bacterium]|nr:class I SAM-dependent methyltransferase [Clostridiaceae bacterium]